MGKVICDASKKKSKRNNEEGGKIKEKREKRERVRGREGGERNFSTTTATEIVIMGQHEVQLRGSGWTLAI